MKRYILDKIKEYNEKNIIDKSDHKKNKEDSYDNIDSLINNMENNEMLTYNLIYLSVIEPKIYQTFCDYCGVKLENNKLVSTANDFKSLKEVAYDNNFNLTTIKKHIEIAANILKHDRSMFGKMILQQEDYIVALLKSLFSSRSMTNENKRNFFSNIISLFNGKIYDDKLIQYIRSIINESADDSLLQYKGIIEKRLVEIEKKHYGKDNDYTINEESSDNSQIYRDSQFEERSGKHV